MALAGSADLVQFLLEKGADPRLIAGDAKPLLPVVVGMMLQFGSLPDYMNDTRAPCTPSKNHIEVARQLLDFEWPRADLNAALQTLATQRERYGERNYSVHAEVMAALQEKGANVGEAITKPAKRTNWFARRLKK